MKRFATLIFLISLCVCAGGTAPTEQLYEGFRNPAKEYGPRVWWHWMHGNVTKDGIRKDLEWMDRVGIAGFHQFNAQLNPTDVIVDRRIELFSPEWDEMFSYALDVADSLGLEVSIASSPGWSITGGPWVSVEDAQKKLTWRALEVNGGKRIRTTLPEPYEFSGPFQEIPQYPDDIYRYRFYRDIAVIAVCTDGMTPADTVAKWQNKAGFVIDSKVSSHSPATAALNAARQVMDISDKVKDGRLDWKAPRGKWTVYRFGYNLLGRCNGPVEKAGKGLEADKLSREAMERYYKDYLSLMDKASDHRLGKTVKYLMIDSYEAGKGTWTPDLPAQFKARRGYDLIPWLPVLAGVVVGSAEQSDDFLFDWRRTLGELIAENHYDLAGEILKGYGMGFHAESHESATAFIGDGMMPKRNAAVPMGAIWVNFNNGWYSSNPTAEADIRESASVAHIYGGNICAAESFSVNSRPSVKGHFPAYQCHPGNLKRLADAALSSGLNRFILHCSPHQPRDDRFPGLGLGSFGNWFNRHETWAEEAKPWHDYLARSCYLLQQGRYVADIAYLYSEDSNVTARFKEGRVPVPFGYSYDFVNSDILRNVLKAENGAVVSPGGGIYRLLVIDGGIDRMTESLRRRISELKDAGVAICDTRGRDAAEAITSALDSLGISPDFNIRERPDTCRRDVRFVHRSLPTADIYWVGNISPTGGTFEMSFRAVGARVSVWDPDGGERHPVRFRTESGRTALTLDMTEDDAKFIVVDKCGKPCSEGETLWSNEAGTPALPIGGPWKISFQAGRGAPESIDLLELSPLNTHADSGIKYFSGTAVYSTDFEYKPDDTRTGELILDLGKVCHMARVVLNGVDLGLLWHAPYSCEVGQTLVKGLNHIEIAVTNDWANRLIGDSSLPKERRITYTPWQFYGPDAVIPESGLLGPVTIYRK